MGRRAAKATHLALFGVGILLYVVFVVPRWWVLIGDIPDTLATVGRIAAGIPIALAALPVLTILRQALVRKDKGPELALRLRAWSAVLHVVAGALILLAAIAEIWLGLGAAGPYLFGVYGAAAAIAILGALALYLSFVAEKPPAEPKAAKPAKPAKVKKAKPEKKPRSKKRGAAKGSEAADPESADTEVADTEATDTEIVETEAAEPETIAVPDTDDSVPADTTPGETTITEQPAALRNKRPGRKLRRSATP